jgi:hypothetical protein
VVALPKHPSNKIFPFPDTREILANPAQPNPEPAVNLSTGKNYRNRLS